MLGAEITCRVYRPGDPRKTLFYERVKGEWEERFERSYGFWRGLVDEVVASYQTFGEGAKSGSSFIPAIGASSRPSSAT